MKLIHDNERGIALVMALVLSFIVLATVSALLYLITQGTVMSGYQKRYETSLEAAKGGMDLVIKEILLKTMPVLSNPIPATLTTIENGANGLKPTYSSLNLLFTSTTSCMVAKLTTTAWEGGTDNWAAAGCTPDNESPYLKSPTTGLPISDMQFTLQGPTSAQNFNVYAKIVDTVGCNPAKTQCPNTLTSGLDLEGSGVVESSSGMVTPKHVPYMYRVEVQAERQNNPDENSRLSVLYAY